MPDTSLQRSPEIVWLGNHEDTVVQHKIYLDTITRMLFPSEHLLLKNPHINALLLRF